MRKPVDQVGTGIDPAQFADLHPQSSIPRHAHNVVAMRLRIGPAPRQLLRGTGNATCERAQTISSQSSRAETHRNFSKATNQVDSTPKIGPSGRAGWRSADCCGTTQPERAAGRTDVARQFQLCAQRLRELLADGQTDAAAAFFARSAGHEQPPFRARRQTGALIADFKVDHSAVTRHARLPRFCPAAWLRCAFCTRFSRINKIRSASRLDNIPSTTTLVSKRTPVESARALALGASISTSSAIEISYSAPFCCSCNTRTTRLINSSIRCVVLRAVCHSVSEPLFIFALWAWTKWRSPLNGFFSP